MEALESPSFYHGMALRKNNTGCILIHSNNGNRKSSYNRKYFLMAIKKKAVALLAKRECLFM